MLDLGSNTVHLLLVDAHYGAAPVPASRLKMPLRLSEHLGDDGRVDDSAVTQLIDFITRGQRLAEDKGATHVLAFATSAIRLGRGRPQAPRALFQQASSPVQMKPSEPDPL